MWKYSQIDEIIIEKLFSKSLEKIKDGWELTHIESKHFSGFTLHLAHFKKYEESSTTS